MLARLFVVAMVASGCANQKAVRQDLSKLRREVHTLRTDLQRTKAQLAAVEQELDLLRVAAAEQTVSPRRRSRRRAKAVPGPGQLPVVRLGADGRAIEEVGAVDDGSPPILIKMGPTTPERISVDREVLAKPDPVLGRDDPEQAYEVALRTLREDKDPVRAKRLLRAFERAHSDSSLADNAAYWTGEAEFMLNEFAAAAATFRRVMRVYPDSGKLQHSLLRLGECLLHLGQVESGLARLKEVVRRYPGTEAADEARAKIESWSQTAPSSARGWESREESR
jgi:tol-pal system protein YbgF